MFLETLSKPPHIIVLTEINAKNYKYPLIESELNIEGYNLIVANLSDNIHRGILMYVDCTLRVIEMEKQIKGFEEYIAINIKGKNNNIIVSAIYRSPNSSPTNDKKLNEYITHVTNNLTGDKIFVGDFNFPQIDWKDWHIDREIKNAGTKFVKCLKENFLIQNVESNTRARGKQKPHILDLIITNDDFIEDIEYLSPIGNSDHATISFVCKWTFVQETENTVKWNYNKGDFDKFRQFMKNWGETEGINSITNVEEGWEELKSILAEGMEKFIPKNKNKNWRRKFNWKHPISKEIKKHIRKKHRLWTRYQKNRDPAIEQKYKKVRNLVNKESKKIDREEQRAVAKNCKENPKKFWKFINSKSKTSAKMGSIKVKNEVGEESIIHDDEEKSNVFMQYFSTVFNQEKEMQNQEEVDPIKNDFTMPDLVITEEMIAEKLDKLKIDKSAGIDNLHPRIIKELKTELAKPLKQIFELSLKMGRLPEDWRSSIITALHKKGSKANVANYRPVSLTCIACKIMEAIIRDHVMSYFKINELFSKKQYGFIKGRSTTLQLLTILDKWTKYLEEGGRIDAVYTDFEKAFDKVSHKKLLTKLKRYGIEDNIIKWIKGYLCDRRQMVRINGKTSKWGPVLSGIPQGSVLGPLLFVIYINDLAEECDEFADIFLFADDAKMFKHIKTDKDVTELQKSCNKFSEWSEKWTLSINVDKCVVLNIKRRADNNVQQTYTLNKSSETKELKCVRNTKDLGVIMDDMLSFTEHISEKIKNAYSMLGIIKRNFKKMDEDTFITLYKTMVRSKLEYAASVWSPHKKTLINTIEKVQKRATKMIRKYSKMSYTQRLKKLKLPTLVYRRLRGDMIEMFKMQTGKYDKELTLKLTSIDSNRTRGNAMKLEIERAKYDIRKYSFSVRSAKLWNSLPDSVIKAETTNLFKNRLDKFWEDQEFKYDHKADI